ncbi:MAG: AgmX/PglI C-terminal domain-containing protein [Nannocystis sp.]|nr:AgmX/PglI C-terminal domain-containing protein [Nannocystis sp.]MBA3550391.1 AgmX/PglI C-terminal domain-containing protein [Nannocystis sp.]
MTRSPTSAAALAEVVVSLGGTILDVRHVGRAAGRASAWSPWLARYTLGEGPDVNLPVEIAGSDASGRFTAVEACAGGIRVALAAGMSGEIVRDGAVLAVEALFTGGQTVVTLQPGERATLHIGALELAIRVEAAVDVPRFAGATLDRPLWLAQGASLLLFAALLVIVRHRAPIDASRFEDAEVQAQLIRYFGPTGPATPEAAAATEPGRVRPDASRSFASRPPAPRPPAPPAPSVAAPAAPATAVSTGPIGHDPSDMAKHAGILGMADFLRAIEEARVAALESMTHYTPSARDTAVWVAAAGRDPMRGLTAGLGLAGTGRQGGGDGRGVIDLDLGSLLFAKVGADGKRHYGGPKRAAREKFAERDPSPQPEHRHSVVWTASVGRDLIRGVVQRNKPAVRQCFREGMVRNPGLSGEVEVGFTIQGDGSVAYPTVVHSSVADPAVEACVTTAIKAWRFPVFVASGGDVDVRFPFTVGAA